MQIYMQIYGGQRTTLGVIQLFQRQISSLAWNSPSSLGLLAEGLGIHLCLHPKSEYANLRHYTNLSVPAPQVRVCKPEPVHKPICVCTPSPSVQTSQCTSHLCLHPKSECANLIHYTSPSVFLPQSKCANLSQRTSPSVFVP